MQPFFQALSHSTTHGTDRTDREQMSKVNVISIGDFHPQQPCEGNLHAFRGKQNRRVGKGRCIECGDDINQGELYIYSDGQFCLGCVDFETTNIR